MALAFNLTERIKKFLGARDGNATNLTGKKQLRPNFLETETPFPTLTEEPTATEPLPTFPLGNIIDIAIEGGFNTLIQALEATNLVTTLQGPGPFTVFAPTDQAFVNLLASLQISLEDLLESPELENILLYHVIDQEVLADTITTSIIQGGSYGISTLNGQNLLFTLSEDTILINENAAITTTDIIASNGVIHVIDEVIIPPLISTETETPTETETSTETETPTQAVNIFNVTNSGASVYIINGESNPTLTLLEGETYTFNINSPNHPFVIKTVAETEFSNAYTNGITIDSGIDTIFGITVVNDSGAYGGGNIFVVDGQSKPTLNLVRGGVYTFDQSDTTNVGHQIAFKDGFGNSYTSGVATTGTLGQAGALIVITVPFDAPDDLRYYCVAHGNNMGNTISVSSGITNGTVTFVVPIVAPTTLYYICEIHSSMTGVINIVNIPTPTETETPTETSTSSGTTFLYSLSGGSASDGFVEDALRQINFQKAGGIPDEHKLYYNNYDGITASYTSTLINVNGSSSMLVSHTVDRLTSEFGFSIAVGASTHQAVGTFNGGTVNLTI